MEKSFQRIHFHQLMERIKEKRKFIQVLTGPRQVGKTTLVWQLIDSKIIPTHYSSADGEASNGPQWISQQWEIARSRLSQGDSNEFLLVLDELQKIPNWSEEIKKQWELDTREKRAIKVILLGSARLLLQQGLTESLAGRFETTYISHWSFAEMKSAFGWSADQYVWFGGYPGSAELIQNEARWKNYINNSLVETNVSKDILMLTRIDKPALLRRLFEFGSIYSGQLLSYNKMLGQLVDAGNTTTLANYLTLLHSAGLLTGLEKFSPDKIRQRSSSPKFQVHNMALMSAQRKEKFAEVRPFPEKWGRVVESAVGAHLLNFSLATDFSVWYWRHINEEIDFVIEKNGKVIGIEVKAGNKSSAKGMNGFIKKFNPDKTFLIGTGGLPWEEFLSTDPNQLF